MISTELRKARNRAGLSQQKLAELAGVSQSQISLYECGKQTPSAENYRKLMDACGVNVTPVAPEEATPSIPLGEFKGETLDQILDHLMGRLVEGEDVVDKILRVMDAACLLKANHALASDEALEELGLVDWHRGVIDDSITLKKHTSKGDEVIAPYGETAKSKSARELARLAELIGERRKTHVLRRDLQHVITGLAMLVREKLRQAAAQGRVPNDVAKELLDALAAESRRQWSEIVYG